MSQGLPNQTVANSFIIWRVPAAGPISKERLLQNIESDIKASAERRTFLFSKFSRRATAERTLRFVLQRGLLTERSGMIYRNDRTVRYINRLPKKVSNLLDTLPIGDPLTLLAGTKETQ